MAMFEIFPRTIYNSWPQLYQQAAYWQTASYTNYATNAAYQTNQTFNFATASIAFPYPSMPPPPSQKVLTPKEDYPLPFNEPLKPITLRPLDLD